MKNIQILFFQHRVNTTNKRKKKKRNNPTIITTEKEREKERPRGTERAYRKLEKRERLKERVLMEEERTPRAREKERERAINNVGCSEGELMANYRRTEETIILLIKEIHKRGSANSRNSIVTNSSTSYKNM